MKKGEVKISANEINRYTYCPYQWYYGKVYGQKALKEKYQALERKTSNHEGNFKKGLHFHEQYYKQYRFKRMVQIVLILVILAVIAGGIMGWWKW